MIKNAKFLGDYFDMNLNIWGDFQICISVPLIFKFPMFPFDPPENIRKWKVFLCF